MGRSLAAEALDCRTLAEVEAAVVRYVERDVGCDAVYLGAAAPRVQRAPLVTGVAEEDVARCEAQGDRYWPDRLVLQDAARAHGGVVEDLDVLSAQERDARPFYREVVRGLGIRAMAASVLVFRGQPVASLYLGRTSPGARFDSALETLRRELPILTLAYVAHDAPAAPDGLTAREHDVLELVTAGHTNARIARALGTSPNTVKTQVASLLAKCDVANRTELVARFGLRPPRRLRG